MESLASSYAGVISATCYDLAMAGEGMVGPCLQSSMSKYSEI